MSSSRESSSVTVTCLTYIWLPCKQFGDQQMSLMDADCADFIHILCGWWYLVGTWWTPNMAMDAMGGFKEQDRKCWQQTTSVYFIYISKGNMLCL